MLMKKHILTWDFLLTAVGCFFGGLLDGYSFLYRNQTFTTVQTGNLVKTFIAFVHGDYFYAVYLLIIFITFCLSILLFYYLCKKLKNKGINYHYILMPLTIIFLIPSMIWTWDDSNGLLYSNVISGIGLSMIGAIMAVAFRSIRFNFDHKILLNLTFMTGNIRTMMFSLSDFFDTKDKDKLHLFYIYVIMIGFFALGASSTALFYFNCQGIWRNYSIIIFSFCLCLLMTLLSHIRYKKRKFK